MDMTEILYDWIVDHREPDLTWDEYLDNYQAYIDRYFDDYVDWCESTALEEQ